MNSPFPGMDPYLEWHWGDVHTRLVTYASDQLAQQMPPDLKVRIQEYVNVAVDDTSKAEKINPDVRILERREPQEMAPALAVLPQTAGASDPLIVPLPREEATLRDVHIIDVRANNRIVTALEFISIANKRSGRAEYLKKQREFLDAGVNLVEIDLLRGGPWVIAAPMDSVNDSHREPYRISVVRNRQYNAELYQASFRMALPTINIPLRKRDADVLLDVQALIDQAYKNGSYDDIDYRREPVPRLFGEDAAWADKLLREQGRRS